MKLTNIFGTSMSIRSILRYCQTALWTVRPIRRCYLLLCSSRAVWAVRIRLIRDTTENCKITTTIWKYDTIFGVIVKSMIDNNRHGPTFICKWFPLNFLKISRSIFVDFRHRFRTRVGVRSSRRSGCRSQAGCSSVGYQVRVRPEKNVGGDRLTIKSDC